MTSKARMTIRFEPPEKTAKPVKTTLAQTVKLVPPPEPAPSHTLTTGAGQGENLPISVEEQTPAPRAYTTWNNPYQDDIRALEEIIRQGEAASAKPAQAVPSEKRTPLPIPDPRPVAQHSPVALPTPEQARQPSPPSSWRWQGLKEQAPEPLEESDESWSLRDLDDRDTEHHDRRGLTGNYTRTREGPSWGRVFLTVTAAIATGALFGYMVLTLFTGEPMFPAKDQAAEQSTAQPSAAPTETANSASSPKDSPAVAQPDEGPATNAGGAAGQLSSIPAEAYYVLQFGVFRTEDSMNAAVRQLQDVGLPYAIEKGSDFRVYAGAGTTRDEAELLAAQIPDLEMYVKPIAAEEMKVSAAEVPTGFVEFMSASAELSRKLAVLSVYGLQDKLPQPPSEDDRTAIDKAHDAWLASSAVVDKLGDKAAAQGKEIVQAIESAMISFAAYDDDPSRHHLWSIQTAVMKELLADRQLRAALQASTTG